MTWSVAWGIALDRRSGRMQLITRAMSQVSPCEKHDGFHQVTTIHHLCRYVKNKFINTILKLFIIDIDSDSDQENIVSVANYMKLTMG
ncbi:unnamed protein product [Rhizophagus irregularis]|nr:unnamed protein product [Rhizophagus irregularis]